MKKYSAFTLIELAIVLTILGLLAGGILVGQDMIRGAQLGSIEKQFTQIQAATFAFRDKYGFLPGDLPNAVSYWGAADGGDGTGNDCRDTNSLTLTDPKRTCNGNGDGITPTGSEGYRFWQHLANAGLIEGEYSGTNASVGVDPGVSVMATEFGELVFWGIIDQPDWAGNTIIPGPADFRNSLQIGSKYSTPHGMPHSGPWALGEFLTPQEAYAIDVKMDDGIARTGSLIAIPRTSTNSWCSTSTGAYRRTSARECALIFARPFN